MLDQFILIAGLLLLVSIIASKASGRYGVPALIIFLVIGMLAGSEGPGGIYFDDPVATQSLGVVALIFILFSGGLDTKWDYVRPVLGSALILATVGVALTALLVGLFAYAILDFTLLEGLLLGAIVSSTDAAAVFAILRSKGVGLRGYIKPLVELESGSNDPMAVFLTTGIIGLMTTSNSSMLNLFGMFIWQMILGALLGYLFGRFAVALLNRVDLEYEGLYPVISVALMLITYAASALLRGNGFLSVFVAGLVLNNSDFIHKRSLLRFHDGMAWLMQIAMFLTLGLLVFPSDLLAIMGYGFLLSLFLIFVARPITVFLTLFRVNVIGLRDKMMVGWVGLRGAVPIVLATFPLLYNIPAADGIFDLVFFIVLTSVLGQGTTIPIIARWLGVDEAVRQRRKPPLEFDPAEPAGGDLIEIEIPANSQAVGKQIVQLGLPETALFVLIDRDGSYVVPRGNTFLQAGDNVMVLADDDSLLRIRELIDVPMRSEVVNAPQAQESS